MYRVARSQLEHIHRRDWDHLIVLDACRYDYFKELYSKYLSGTLISVMSPASDTSWWLKRVWTGYWDLTYFSTSPAVNSKGIAVWGFKAVDRFKEIVDIWEFGWHNNLSTVPPWEVNRAVRKEPVSKSVIHYMQPHGPWIGETKLVISDVKPDTKEPVGADKLIADMVKRGEISIDTLRVAYRDNLELVLSHVKELLEHLSGTVIVTSDHGELLGEYGLYLHPPEANYSELRLIPWLIIK